MDPVSIPSTVSSVTVYSSGAVCVRLAHWSPEGGALPRQVRFAGLPLSCDPSSLRGRIVRGPPGLRVLDARLAFLVEPISEQELPAAQRAIEAAEQTYKVLTDRQTFLNEEIQCIEQLGPRFPNLKKGEPPRKAAVEAILALSQTLDSQLQTLHAKRFELDEELRDARHALELAQQRLAEGSSSLRGERDRLEANAVLTLSDTVSDEVELAVEYRIPGARWAPAYDLVLDRTLSQGKLVVRASVAQRSGEDWRGVALSLSTADLMRRNELPKLRSLRIGRAQPEPLSAGWRDPPAGLEPLFAGYDSALASRPSRPPPPEVSTPPPPAAPAALFASAPCGEQPEELIDAECSFAMEEIEAPPPRAAGPLSRARRSQTVAVAKQAPAPLPKDAGDPEDRLLDYGTLLLSGPDEGSRRGKLHPHSPRDLLRSAGPEPMRRASGQLDRALAEAAQVEAIPLPEHAAPVRQSAGSYDYRYDARLPVDIPSDGVWHTITLFDADVSVSPEYLSVPSLEPLVYRVVHLENRTPHAFLEGPAEVLRGGGHLMTVRLPTVPPLGRRRVGLGVEESIRVARNVRFEESTSGLLGGSTTLAHRIELELANHLPHVVTLEIQERLPVIGPGEKEIQLEEQRATPSWEPFIDPDEPVPGARRWRVTLAAGESRKLSAAYAIKIPGSKLLAGGNRRD